LGETKGLALVMAKPIISFSTASARDSRYPKWFELRTDTHPEPYFRFLYRNRIAMALPPNPGRHHRLCSCCGFVNYFDVGLY